MKIRKLEIKDIEILEVISREQFVSETMRPKFNYLVEDINYQIQIIEENDIVLGYIVIKFLDKDLIDIHSIAVKKEYQNKGYGFKLLSNILEIFINFKFILEVSEKNTARRLYSKCGFKIDGIRKKYYGQEDGILMSYSKFAPGSEES